MGQLEKHIKENVINGRDLKEFERTLGFNRIDLEGHRVLNFGSGGSNIGKELKAKGVNCDVTDVDILPNPHSVHDENFTAKEYALRSAALERKVREFQDGQLLLKNVEDHENTLLGIDGRNFVQLDGSGKLPFPDNSFDDVFVSWVFHQLPESERGNYLREFMRVGKRIYISPVGRRELDGIEYLIDDSHFFIKSLTSLRRGNTTQITISEDSKSKNKANGWTEDGYAIKDLEIDSGQRPYSVYSSSCARVILEKTKSKPVVLPPSEQVF